MKRAFRLLSMLFVISQTSAFAQGHIKPLPLSEAVQDARMIVVLEVIAAGPVSTDHEQRPGTCGYLYTANPVETLKGTAQSPIVFRSLSRLMIGVRYLAFVPDSRANATKEQATRGTSTQRGCGPATHLEDSIPPNLLAFDTRAEALTDEPWVRMQLQSEIEFPQSVRTAVVSYKAQPPVESLTDAFGHVLVSYRDLQREIARLLVAHTD
jgi:hypothetical protein